MAKVKSDRETVEENGFIFKRRKKLKPTGTQELLTEQTARAEPEKVEAEVITTALIEEDMQPIIPKDILSVTNGTIGLVGTVGGAEVKQLRNNASKESLQPTSSTDICSDGRDMNERQQVEEAKVCTSNTVARKPMFTISTDGSSEEEAIQLLFNQICRAEYRNTLKAFSKQPCITTAVEALLRDFCAEVADVTSGVESLLRVSTTQDTSRIRLKRRLEILHQTKQEYEREVHQWEDQVRKVDTWSNEPSQRQAEAALRDDAEGCAPEFGLKETCSASHRSLELQVDGIQSMLENLEDICDQADHMCTVLAQDLHGELFNNFPHVGSPTKLIHQLIKE